MPDVGGIRRRLAEQAKQAAQQASQAAQQVSQAGLQHLEHYSADHAPGARAAAEEGASEEDVAEEVNRLQAFLASRRPPPGPVQGRWSIGIGDLLAEHPRVPDAASSLVRQLDRYGGLAVSPRTIEFDHDAIEWASVTEVRTRNVVDYLLSDGLIQQIDTLPVPWFPGRKRVLGALSEALLTLVVTAAKEQLDRHGDVRIPAEVEYRGAIRRNRQLAPGILAALVMADPAVNQCIQATALANGVTVRPAVDATLNTAGQHAEQLRAKLNALESRLGREPSRLVESVTSQRLPMDGIEIATAVPAALGLRLPDQGDALIRLAAEASGKHGASVIAAEVAAIRRPDGVLAFDDCRASKSFMKSPAYSLAGLLNMESISVSVWASASASMLQRRSLQKHVERLCQGSGVVASVEWALANVDGSRLPLGLLRETLISVPANMPGGEALMRSELARALRKRR
ncbi:MAG: hypothetical protein JST91_31375 [Actinobacteria bacterium]|nr:hypothetical protein [Actinomycetota bacterium]